ncbi:MAG: hypothetical protein SFV18_07390 [Bryobacteraceae bacterium]|nr:hypothetical protein [Bryobacteraceae bacterium]
MTTVADEVRAARDQLMRNRPSGLPEWENARVSAERLHSFVRQRLDSLAAQMKDEISSAQPSYRFNVVSVSPLIVLPEAIKSLLVQPALADFDQNMSLVLRTEKQSLLSLAQFAVGPRFYGLIGAVMTLSEGMSLIWHSDLFLINYREPTEHAEKRFRPWLEDALTQGLAAWRKTL